MALTVQTLRRLEIWDKWEAAGGVRQSVLAEALLCTALGNLDATEKLTAAFPLSLDTQALVTVGSILRVDGGSGVFDEWKIVTVTDDDSTPQRSIEAGLLLSTDMLDGDLVRRIDSDGVNVFDFESVGLSAADHITQWVLPAYARAGLGWIGLGTIETSRIIDLTFSWATPLNVLQQIASLTETELYLRRIPGGYVIDLLEQIGSDAQIADVRVDKNLRPGTTRALSAADQATRVFPKGAVEEDTAATMARATWRVDGIYGSNVSLADSEGGPGPIQFDGQLAGLNGTTQAYLRKPSGELTAVTASSVADQSVTLASVADLAIGDTVQFRADAAGSDLSWLDSPPDRLLYGLKAGSIDLPDIPSTINLLKNAAMRAWAGPADEMPDYWAKLGAGTVDRQAAGPFTRTGGFSVHRFTTADGDGMVSDTVPLFLSTLNQNVSGYAGLWVVSGQVRVELLFTTPTGVVVEPVAPDFATSSFIGQWEDLGVTFGDGTPFTLGATAVALRVTQHGTTPAEFYLDYGQVTESSSQLPFAESSGGTKLWQAANERLRTNGAPIVSYGIMIVDYPDLDPVVVGGRVRVTDPRLAIAVTARVTEIERNYTVPRDTRITLSNKPDEITGKQARPRAPRALLRGKASSAAAPYSAIGINDLKVIREATDSLTRGWVRGALVADVWAGYQQFAVPVPDDPWAEVRSNLEHLPTATDEFTVPKPSEGFQVYWHIEARLADLTVGDVREGIVDSAPTQPPLIELDDAESATTGTQWWKITERGLTVITVEVQTQVGSEPVSAFGPPTRSAGAASVVRGGVLGAGEYEHDVTLDATRLAWIMPRYTLNNGQPPKTLGPFGFDRDKRPNILSIDVTGTKLSILCDSDTKSIVVSNSDATWVYEADGVALVVDVALTGTNGGAGLGASASDTYTITAQSDPIAYVGVDTLTESRSQVIGGATAPPAGATWKTPGVAVAAPATNGSDDATINLFASAAPVGWTVALYIYVGFSSSGTPTVDHTADVTPTLTAPPTVATDYTYATGFIKSAHTAGTGLVTMKVRADLKDGSGVVQDSKTVQATWYSPV